VRDGAAMILRRLTQHIRDQNWFAVGLDLGIVVLGVIIGFQVTAWNDARNDTARGRGYLERVHADLGVDVEIYTNRTAFWALVSDHGLRALAAAEGGEGAETHGDDWGLIVDFFQASQVAEVQTTQTAYLEITSAGELGLISNEHIRREITEYYALIDNSSLSERPAYRENVRGLIPIDAQLYIWSDCFRTSVSGAQFLIDCESPLTSEEARRVVTRLTEDDGLHNQLRYWISTLRVATLISDGRRDHANELRDAIDTELGTTQ
jgi:hypothetical protein